MTLEYRKDWDNARQRLTAWWHGRKFGRPVMLLTAPRATPKDTVTAMPEPPGWVHPDSAANLPYRVNLALRTCLYRDYLGEAAPSAAAGDLGTGTLALFLGSTAIDTPGSVWSEPCIEDPDEARLSYDPDNCYWRFCLEVYRQTLTKGRGKFLAAYPDLIEGLDTLAALRGSQRLLVDLVDRPEWVHQCLRRITDLYFRYYDVLYDLIRDETGGSASWCWAPGRTAKLQCDFSTMISPAMFREFMVPVLTEMTERLSYSFYHLDGPGAIMHLGTLLAIPRLGMIQWVAGAGEAPGSDPKWWPMFHRILDAGKRVFVLAEDRDQLRALKREFGSRVQDMVIHMTVTNVTTAEACLDLMSV